MLLSIGLVVAGAFVALVVAVVVKALGVARDQKVAKKMLAGYRGPPEKGIWGNAKERRDSAGKVNDMHLNYIRKYTDEKSMCYKLISPTYFRGLNGGRSEIFSADPRIVQHVLKDKFDVYTKSALGGRGFRAIRKWLGSGIFFIDHGPYAESPRDGGAAWALQRRTALGIFTRTLFTHYYQDVFTSHGVKLISALEKARGPDGTSVLDIQFYMNSYTMDSFGKIAFGTDLGNLEGNDTGFGKAFDGAHLAVIKFMRSRIVPLLLSELLPEALMPPFHMLIESTSPAFKTLKEHTAALDRYTYSIIKERRSSEDYLDEAKASDLLAQFMRMTDDAGKPMFTDLQLRDIIMSFMIAGRDTTASTLSWMWYELGLEENKPVLDALLEEIDLKLEGDVPTLDAIAEMPYLRGVIWETIRLHPIVPATQLTAKIEDTLPDGTTIQAGTRVLFSTYAMGRDPKRYGDDVMQFKPTRWIPFNQPSPFEFPAFKGGRRLCLGKDMALFESSVIAIHVLQKYVPVLATAPEDVTYAPKLTMSVFNSKTQKEELLVRLRARDNAPTAKTG